MAAPVIHWIRPGVGYAPDAAASMLRLEAALGRKHDCNSSYRDYAKQLGMYNAWNAYKAGRGPKPPHSRAIHPDNSMHCRGLADDSDDWTTPGYIALAAEHGWIRTAAWDPTERHHFEYQAGRDQHRNDNSLSNPTTPAAPDEEEDDMFNDDDRENVKKSIALSESVLTELGKIKPEVARTGKVADKILEVLAAVHGAVVGKESTLQKTLDGVGSAVRRQSGLSEMLAKVGTKLGLKL